MDLESGLKRIFRGEMEKYINSLPVRLLTVAVPSICSVYMWMLDLRSWGYIQHENCMTRFKRAKINKMRFVCVTLFVCTQLMNVQCLQMYVYAGYVHAHYGYGGATNKPTEARHTLPNSTQDRHQWYTSVNATHIQELYNYRTSSQ